MRKKSWRWESYLEYLRNRKRTKVIKGVTNETLRLNCSLSLRNWMIIIS